ncbi:MAG: hypothetical protein ABF625_07575 [Leuconostoc mesenteroides]
MTDKYGNKLSSQYIQGNNGKMEYFILNGKYKVISQTATTINVEIGGEPVSMIRHLLLSNDLRRTHGYEYNY